MFSKHINFVLLAHFHIQFLLSKIPKIMFMFLEDELSAKFCVVQDMEGLDILALESLSLWTPNLNEFPATLACFLPYLFHSDAPTCSGLYLSN